MIGDHFVWGIQSRSWAQSKMMSLDLKINLQMRTNLVFCAWLLLPIWTISYSSIIQLHQQVYRWSDSGENYLEVCQPETMSERGSVSWRLQMLLWNLKVKRHKNWQIKICDKGSGQQSSYMHRSSTITSQMTEWQQGCDIINDYKPSPSQTGFTNPSLPESEGQELQVFTTGVTKTFMRINPHKAAEPGNISGRVLKDCAELKGVFMDVFNTSLRQTVSSCLMRSIIVPPENKSILFNDPRPVDLMSVVQSHLNTKALNSLSVYS